ncbi:hypothetical protein [Botrimarina colliarenosi]|uniref:hypothetical protein n=1 Tax=Botrimarina colliarenosi TaxID=2528001 RepID=UPI0011B82A12|nr:hypothetical protein [Botrimarina colliarenosi]
MKDHSGSALDPYSSEADPAPEVETLHRTMRVVVSGGRVAWSRQGDAWDTRAGGIVRKDRVAAFNGEESRILYRNAKQPIGFQNGSGKPHEIVANHGEINPIYYATDPQSLLTLKGYILPRSRITSHASVSSNVKTAVLEVQNTYPQLAVKIVVNPEAGGRVESLREVLDGTVLREVSLQYREDAQVGWIIDSWTTDYFDSEGEPTLKISGEVTEASVNVPIQDSEFEVLFPEGTHVKKDGKYYEVAADGSSSEITLDRYGTSDHKDAWEQGSFLRKALIAATLIATVALAGAVAAKRWHRL